MTNEFRWMRTGVGAVAAVLGALLILACGSGPTQPSSDACLTESEVDPGAPVTRIGVHFMAGGAHLLAGNEAQTANGATFKPTKARFYASQLALIDAAGQRVAADLVDANGERLPYGVALVDLDRPESLQLDVKAPAGHYQGMAISVGVPEKCASGERLNHVDASQMPAPLDVDSDMYWTWNSGYVFLKFEGQVRDGSSWAGFFYHVGEDARFAALELPAHFAIPAEGGEGPQLVADFNQLLVSPAGASNPDITDDAERRVHGGVLADALAENLRGSGFLRIAEGSH